MPFAGSNATSICRAALGRLRRHLRRLRGEWFPCETMALMTTAPGSGMFTVSSAQHRYSKAMADVVVEHKVHGYFESLG